MTKKSRNAIVLTVLLAAMIAIATFAGGCQSDQISPKAQFVAAQKIYCTTVDSLTQLKLQGQISNTDTANITIAVNEGAAYLERWKLAIDEGHATLDYYAEFQGILDKLLLYQTLKE